VLDTVRATEQSQLEAVAAKDVRGATRNYDQAAVVLAPGGASVSGAPAIESEYEAVAGRSQLRDRDEARRRLGVRERRARGYDRHRHGDHDRRRRPIR
jgi:ketosteroid isomerase-like protein